MSSRESVDGIVASVKKARTTARAMMVFCCAVA